MRMEELFDIGQATGEYSDHPTAVDSVPPFNCQTPPFPGRIPVFGSDRFNSGSSAVSEAASEIPSESSHEDEASGAVRAKIVSHPLYPKLVDAYIDCQKVGAPAEIGQLLEEIRRGTTTDTCKRTAVVSSCLGDDPELDEFMETYWFVLAKYKSDLSRPFDEATSFLSSMQRQLNTLCSGAVGSFVSDEAVGSSEEDASAGEVELQEYQRTSEERELKDKLLRKYSGYISSLKQEFLKNKKKGKLPKEAREILFEWWSIHYKWPYPTDADKVALAELTGLDQKQINNWFINQRKRHWKPSDNMQFLYGPVFMNG